MRPGCLKNLKNWHNAALLIESGYPDISSQVLVHRLCRICQESITVFKKHKIKRHFSTKQRHKKVLKLRSSFISRQNIFAKQLTVQESTMKASYVPSYKLVDQSKPFSDGEFLKDCMMVTAVILCPGNKRQFSAALCCNMSTLIESVTQDSVQIQIHKQLTDGKDTRTSSSIQHYTDLSSVFLSALRLSMLITSLYSTVYQSSTVTETPGFHLRWVDGAGTESRVHEVRAHLTARRVRTW